MKSKPENITIYTSFRDLPNLIAASVLISINALFLIKYGVRIHTLLGIGLSFIYTGFFTTAFLDWANLDKISSKIKPKWLWLIGIILSCGIGLLSYLFIPLESLQVDRWSVVDNFLSAYFTGSNPYLATSHMGNYPGPLPFYFILYVPFYITKLYVLPPVIGSILLFGLTKKESGFSRHFVLLLLVITSPCLYYEILTRSNILCNSVLYLMVFSYLLKCVNRQQSTIHMIGFFLLGLLLSTRAILIIPTLFLFIYYVRFSDNLSKSLALFFVSGISFCLSFVPLWIRSLAISDMFTPFTIQSSQLIPFSFVLAFILISIILAFKSKNAQDVILYSGWILYAIILTYLIRLCVIHGWAAAISESKADISYFLFCVPFIVSYLIDKPYASQ